MFFDWHYHSVSSLMMEGSSSELRKLVKIADQNDICVNLVESFDFSSYKENNGSWVFSESYFKKLESFRDKHNLKIGLEVGYEPQNEQEILEFLDSTNYDFYIGAIHSINENDLRTRKGMRNSLSRYPFVQLRQMYYKNLKKLLECPFPWNGICHLDIIYGFIHDLVIGDISYERDKKLYRISKKAIEKDILFEINLDGLFSYPVNRTFPAESMIEKLQRAGGNFFIGSGSNNIREFEKRIPMIKKYATKYKEKIKILI